MLSVDNVVYILVNAHYLLMAQPRKEELTALTTCSLLMSSRKPLFKQWDSSYIVNSKWFICEYHDTPEYKIYKNINSMYKHTSKAIKEKYKSNTPKVTIRCIFDNNKFILAKSQKWLILF